MRPHPATAFVAEPGLLDGDSLGFSPLGEIETIKNGDDEAITSEPPEERVTAAAETPVEPDGSSPSSLAKWSGAIAAAARKQGGTAGVWLVPVEPVSRHPGDHSHERADHERDPSYPNVETQPSFPRIEREVLAFWDGDRTFEASVAARADADEYVFYDGPPFANGLPHYGHLLTGFVKDAVPRYRTMRGQKVDRRFGWDCHGLPAEVVAEKELGISGHPAITEVRHRQVQRCVPHQRAALHRRLASLRHPPGTLGGLRATTTRPSTSPTWRA